MTDTAQSAPIILDEHYFKAMAELVVKEGWESISLVQLADLYGGGATLFLKTFSVKENILKAFIGYLDQATLDHLPLDLETFDRHDRLFEVFMARFEVARPYKEALARIWQEESLSPHGLTAGLPLGVQTIETLLKAANVLSPGLMSCLQIQGFGLMYIAMVRTWFSDHTPDQQKTMAEVDIILKKYGEYLLLL